LSSVFIYFFRSTSYDAIRTQKVLDVKKVNEKVRFL
jgi:hypothetical protein